MRQTHQRPMIFAAASKPVLVQRVVFNGLGITFSPNFFSLFFTRCSAAFIARTIHNLLKFIVVKTCTTTYFSFSKTKHSIHFETHSMNINFFRELLLIWKPKGMLELFEGTLGSNSRGLGSTVSAGWWLRLIFAPKIVHS